MSSDQHFSPPRFCFTLLITGSPLTTDKKNYSSKTCGRCARRALYNVRYNPLSPAPPGPARKAITLLSRVRLSLRLIPGPWQHYYSLVYKRAHVALCVRQQRVLYTRSVRVCKRQAFQKCLLFGRSGKWRYCLNRMTKGNAIWNSFVVFKNPSVLLLNNISLTRKYIPLES